MKCAIRSIPLAPCARDAIVLWLPFVLTAAVGGVSACNNGGATGHGGGAAGATSLSSTGAPSSSNGGGPSLPSSSTSSSNTSSSSILDAGPSDASAGPYVWKNAQIVGGGYVPSVVFNPSEKDLIYARTDMGGAYRWDPANSVWIPLLDWVSMNDWNLWGMEEHRHQPRQPKQLLHRRRHVHE